MHLEKQKPRFQLRILEYEKDGISFKKTKSSNIYPNSDNLTFEEIWEKIRRIIENE